jgi:hypothetical protein
MYMYAYTFQSFTGMYESPSEGNISERNIKQNTKLIGWVMHIYDYSGERYGLQAGLLLVVKRSLISYRVSGIIRIIKGLLHRYT